MLLNENAHERLKEGQTIDGVFAIHSHRVTGQQRIGLTYSLVLIAETIIDVYTYSCEEN